MDKIRKYDNFYQIEAGDEVAIDSNVGCCSGGARYGITSKVEFVTDTEIVTSSGSRYSRVTGEATVPPYAYAIEWWVSNKE